MIRRAVLAAALLVIAGLGIGCGAVPLPCDVTIAALPPASAVEAGDPLPGDVLVLAGPEDIGPVTIGSDPQLGTTVDIELRGDAIARMAAHTAGHTGEFLAIAVNGTVATVPSIQGQIADGRIQISSGSLGSEDLGEQFAGCTR